MKPSDVQSSIFTDFNTENDKRVLKYKNNVAKDHVPNWSEEGLVITKVKNTVLQTYITSNLNGKEIVDKFYRFCYFTNYKKQIKKSLEWKKY